MGVNWKHYIVRGVKIDGKAWEKWIEHDKEVREDFECKYNDVAAGELTIISDPYNGAYTVIGIKLFESEDGRYEQADIPMTILDNDLSRADSRVVQFLNVNDMKIEDNEPKTIIFTHYS